MKGNRGMTAAVTSTGQNLLVDDVAIVFSGTSFAMPVIVHPASSQCWQGAIGADLLRNCTLVWGYRSLHAACHAPAKGE